MKTNACLRATAWCLWLCCLLLAACAPEDETVHRDERGLAVTARLPSNLPETPGGEVWLYVFDASDRLVLSRCFGGGLREMAACLLPLDRGDYTVALLAGIGLPEPTEPESATLPAFVQWSKEMTGGASDVLSGMQRATVPPTGFSKAVVELAQGYAGLRLPLLRLRLTMPSGELLPYVRAAGYTRRVVVEAVDPQTHGIALRRTFPLQQQDNGAYEITLPLSAGTYSLRLWADYVQSGSMSDCFYLTTDGLEQIAIRTSPYTACTDEKDAAAAFLPLVVLPEEGTTCTASLARPLARYRLVATDVEGYLALVANGSCPPLEELTLHVEYDGFFPAAFCVERNEPCDALRGIAYTLPLPLPAEYSTELQLCNDWIISSTERASVTLTVTLTDRQGTVVSRTNDVRVDYRRGQLTTLRGKFLTAGKSPGGVSINEAWEDDVVIDF